MNPLEVVQSADAENLEFTQVMFKAYTLTPPDIKWGVDAPTGTWFNPAQVCIRQTYVIIGSPMHHRVKVGDYQLLTRTSPDGTPSLPISGHACHHGHPDPQVMFQPLQQWNPVGYFHQPTPKVQNQ